MVVGKRMKKMKGWEEKYYGCGEGGQRNEEWGKIKKGKKELVGGMVKLSR